MPRYIEAMAGAGRRLAELHAVATAFATLTVLNGMAVAGAQAQTVPVPVPVQIASVQAADVPLILQGIGNVQAFNTVTLRAQVDGILTQVRFVEGQPVKAGQVLAQIDPRPYQAALDQAVAKKAQDEAQLQNAKLNLQRFENVGDYASRQQVATQQSMVAQLEAQTRGDQGAIDSAQTQLGYTALTSPLDGITGIRLVDPGNLLRATDATGIVVVTQIQPVSVIFTLPADALAELRKAMADGPLHVTVLERQGSRPLGEGTLVLVDNEINPATGTLRLKATLPNTDSALWPGQFVNVRLLLRTEEGVPTVPSTAIQRGPDGPWLYTVKADNTVAVAKVAVRRYADGVAVLDNGPAAGTAVVVGGQYRLVPGARIQAVPVPKP